MAETRIEISIDPVLGAQALAKFEKTAVDAGTQAGKVAGEGFGKSLTSSIIKAEVIIAAIKKTFGAITDVFKESVKASAENEDAINQLNIALASSGQYSAAASKGIQDLASSLQNTTKFADDVIIKNAALIQSLGRLDSEGLKKATIAAADMSSALGIDLTSASTLVGKAATGNITAFGKLGIEIKKGATDAETFSNAMKALNDRFAGAAAGQINTFEGSLARLKNIYGDVLETIGDIITKSPSLRAVVSFIGDAVARLGGVIKDLSKGDPLKPIIFGFLDVAKAVNDYVVPAVVGLKRAGEIVLNGIISSLNLVVAGFAKVGQWAGKLIEAIGGGGALSQALIDFGDTSAQVYEESLLPLSQSMDSFLDPIPLQEKFDSFNNGLRAAVDQAKPSLDTLVKNGNDALAGAANSAKQTAVNVGAVITGVLTKAVSSGIQAITKTLVLGENGFKNFGQAISATMGDMAIQLGEMFIAAGIAIEATKTLGGFAAIAAGAALVAVGTILKSFSGGTPGLGSAGGGGGGDSGGGGVGSDQTGIATGQVEERRSPDTKVALTINGDVFDSDETGTRIAKILADSFSRDDIIVTA